MSFSKQDRSEILDLKVNNTGHGGIPSKNKSFVDGKNYKAFLEVIYSIYLSDYLIICMILIFQLFHRQVLLGRLFLGFPEDLLLLI